MLDPLNRRRFLGVTGAAFAGAIMLDGTTLPARWRAEAQALGFEPDQVVAMATNRPHPDGRGDPRAWWRDNPGRLERSVPLRGSLGTVRHARQR